MNYIAKKIALQEKNILNHADLYLDYNNRIAFHKNRKINLTEKNLISYFSLRVILGRYLLIDRYMKLYGEKNISVMKEMLPHI